MLQALILALLIASPVHAAQTLPPAPSRLVLDEAGALSKLSAEGLQKLLLEHAHVTGEQIVVAVFTGAEGEDPTELTHRAFREWKVGGSGKDNGALLALFWKERKTRLEVGFGIEGLLTESRAEEILNDTVSPDLKRGDPERALDLGTLEILRTLGSPVVQSGQAIQILRQSGFRGEFVPNEAPAFLVNWINWFGWPVLVPFGLILMAVALNWLLAADAHFTSAGWYRPPPWRHLFRNVKRASGGASGQW